MDNDKRRQVLGDAIREERERQGLSQRQLARMIGSSTHSYIVEIEKGTKSVGFDKLCSLADALGVEVNYFFVRF